MASTATLESSKANRRFILLAVVLGLIGAALIYVVLNRDSGPAASSRAAGDTAVVVAKVDIPARSLVSADMLEVKLLPASAVSELAYSDTQQVVGQYTRFAIAANETILSSKVVPTSGSAGGVTRALSYTIPEGKRGIAVSASPLSQAGGLILPGDYIDILVVYNVEFGNDVKDAYMVQTIMQNIEVLAISTTVVDTVGTTTVNDDGQRPRNSEARATPDASTVTLLVTPEQAQTLFLAERNGELRMALRAFGDGTEQPIEYLTEVDLFPENIPAPVR